MKRHWNWHWQHLHTGNIDSGRMGTDLGCALVQGHDHADETSMDCPSVNLGRYDQLWDMLRDRLEELFKFFSDSVYVCEVRYDIVFGGPILTLTDEDGYAESFMVSIPRHFGKSD